MTTADDYRVTHQMTTQRLVDIYLDGWRTGDAEKSYSTTAPGFTYDDPDTGLVQRDDFTDFFNDFKQAAADLKGSPVTEPFLTYSDTVMDTSGDVWTVWCWWHAVGTDFQGCAVIKADGTGVLSEKIAYYTPLPKDS